MLWVLLFLTLLFAYLAFDALSMATSHAMPFSLFANGLGQDVSHMSVKDQRDLEQLHARVGIGKLRIVGWLFLFLAVAFGVATILLLVHR